MKKIEVDSKYEYYAIFFAVLLFIVFNEYAKKVIGFYDKTFLLITAIASFPFLIISASVLWMSVLVLDYISFFRRIFCVLLIGLSVNILFVSGIKIFRAFYNSRPVGEAVISRPVLALNASRIGYETIGFNLLDRKLSLRVSGKTVGDLQTNGLESYCVYLNIKKGNEYFIIDKYWVDYCGK